MLHLKMDTETYSEVDITKAGGFKYCSDPSTRLLCLSYKINNERTQLWAAGYVDAGGNWKPGNDMPDDLRNAALVCSSGQGKAFAFNATFDLQIWNLCVARDYEVEPIALENWIDVQAVCARFKLPQNLLNTGKVLGCATEKMAVGKVLIRKCCKPGGNPTARDYEDLCVYCIVDTDVMDEIMQRLPVAYLTEFEQQVWEMTYKMNEYGVPIDLTANKAILKYLAIYIEGQKKILPEITNGEINTVGQIAKVKAFCKKHGTELPNLSAETVTATLAREDLSDIVRTVLKLRQELGKSSVKKFITIDEMVNNGVVQGNLNYYGAGTGRWAGRGLQYHNLPRAKVDDPDLWIQRFKDREIMADPMGTAKALIRSMIVAPPGHKLIVRDYSSIENRYLAWLAGDELTLQGFREDFDQYKDMACFLYKKELKDIQKSERQLGKALILGCGYGMSFRRFVVAAQTYGVFMNETEAKFAVDAYRKKYQLIVKMWYRLANAIMNAVKFPGKSFMSNKCTCSVVTDKVKHKWLRIKLPSGRALMYMDPTIMQGKYGPAVCYHGMNAKTFQWTSKELTPGLITENVTQAGARDVLCEGMLHVQKNLPEAQLILCVHDEAGIVVPEELATDEYADAFGDMLCVHADYRADMPLKAEGYTGHRYKKD